MCGACIVQKEFADNLYQQRTIVEGMKKPILNLQNIKIDTFKL
jgi:hypothetical protein